MYCFVCVTKRPREKRKWKPNFVVFSLSFVWFIRSLLYEVNSCTIWENFKFSWYFGTCQVLKDGKNVNFDQPSISPSTLNAPVNAR